MKLTKEEALTKAREAFPDVSDGNVWNTPVGIKGVLNILEALGLVELVEFKIETVEIPDPTFFEDQNP